MSQASMTIEDGSGSTVLAAINAAFAAQQSNQSGGGAPASPAAFQFWADTASGWLKQRDAANLAWIKRMPLGTAARVDVASAATLDLTAAAVTSDYLCITGTTAITAVTLEDGQRRFAVAGGAFKLTNGANLILPGAADYTTTMGDLLRFFGESSGVVRVEVSKAVASSVPTGTIIYVAQSSAPSGYLKANGAAISRTTYGSLFAAIGTTFGAGDGSTTFNLPDLRGEFVRGWDDARGVDSGRGIGTSQAEAFKAHYHRGGDSSSGGYRYGTETDTSVYPSTSSAGTSTLAPLTSTVGGTETRPRNVALLACIKY